MRLPERHDGETLADWIRRVNGIAVIGTPAPATADQLDQQVENRLLKFTEEDRIRAHGMGIALLLLLCLALPAHGQDNKALNRASLWASIGTRSTDAIQTCYVSRVPGWREHGAPAQSCAGVAAWNAGMVLGGWAGGRLLHRMGWHRVESVPNWISAGWAAEGVAYTSIHTRH